MVGNKNTYGLASAIIQKERRQIIQYLRLKTRNISDLSKLTKLDRATVSYHLGVLEHNKLVKSSYKMLRVPHSMGKIGRYYIVDEGQLRRAESAIKKLNKF